MTAADKGERATVEQLLAAGAELNLRTKKGNTALMMAAYGGHSSVVEQLLAAGADPNIQTKQGDTALTRARRYGS